MATGDITARNSRANDFAADYATATLTFLSGATTLAAHTLAGFAAASGGVITANAIADETSVATGTCDSVTLSDTAGLYPLTVGLSGSGADVIIDKLDFTIGGNSHVDSMAINFP